MNWYALQVRSQYEQRLCDALRAFEAFYPWRENRSNIGRHQRLVRRALFPGYVFCHCRTIAELPALTIPQGWRLVSKEPIPDIQIESVRQLALSKSVIMEHPPVLIGEQARVTQGILKDVEGTVIRFQEKNALLVVTLQVLNKSVAVALENPDWLEAVKPVKRVAA